MAHQEVGEVFLSFFVCLETCVTFFLYKENLRNNYCKLVKIKKVSQEKTSDLIILKAYLSTYLTII